MLCDPPSILLVCRVLVWLQAFPFLLASLQENVLLTTTLVGNFLVIAHDANMNEGRRPWQYTVLILERVGHIVQFGTHYSLLA